jgi:hypothetical protein
MRDDLPSSELQDLRPVASDGPAPIRWVRSVNRACTEWLLERGLLDEMLEDLLFLRHASGEGEPKETDLAPTKDATIIEAEPSPEAVEGPTEAGEPPVE